MQFGDKLLVTTLFSRTQPLIRYELGDNIRIQPGVFHNVMDVVANKGWQIAQDPDGVMVLVMGLQTRGDEEKIRQAIASALTSRGVPGVKITVKKVDAIPKSTSGKSPLIKAL